MNFETAAEEKERLEKQFDEIKLLAWKKDFSNSEHILKDSVDRLYLRIVQAIYQNYKSRTVDVTEGEKQIEFEKNKYVTEKRKYEQYMKLQTEQNEARHKFSQDIKRLKENFRDMTPEEIFEIIYAPFYLLFDFKTAEQIKRTAGLRLLKGLPGSYSDEEFEQVAEEVFKKKECEE